MKKLLYVLCLLLALVCVFAACDKSETPSTNNGGANTEQSGGGNSQGNGNNQSGNQTTSHTHNWSAWEVTTPAVCGTNTDGEQKRACACGASETIPLLAQDAHIYSVDNRCKFCQYFLQETSGLEYILNSGEESYTVKKGTALENTMDVVIPYYHNEKPVTAIGAQGFSNTALTSIQIPHSVTEIHSSAFEGCNALTSITIPASVTEIGLCAFKNCTALTAVHTPSLETWCNIRFGYTRVSLGYVGYSNPLCYAQNLYIENSNSPVTEIDIPNTVTAILDLAFSGWNGTSIRIPESVTEIGHGAFTRCDSLVNITIPDSITMIGNGAFEDCNSLISVTLPASVTSLGEYTFSHCSNLANINFEEVSQLLYIGAYAFVECTSLKSIQIPASVIEIGYGAFMDCTFLSNVLFNPNSKLTDLGSGVFANCGNLTCIALPASISRINSSMFENCAKLTNITIPASVTDIAADVFNGCINLASVMFEENSQLTSIGYSTFKNCGSLTNIIIPASVVVIGADAFTGCTQLIQVEGGVSYVDKWVIACDVNTTNVDLRANTVGIGPSVFYNSKLTSIVIPESVTSIDDGAFSSCVKLANVIFSENSQLNNIGAKTFYYCTAITSITIPASVTYIQTSAFENCSELTNVIFAENSQLTYIGSNAFKDCENLTSITLSETNHLTSIGSSAFNGCDNLKNITLPSSVTNIGEYALRDISVVNITSIEAWCNINFSSKTANPLYFSCVLYLNGSEISGNMVIPEGIAKIPLYAFYGCDLITSITIPSSVTSIGAYAFCYCPNLSEINFNATAMNDLNRESYVFKNAGKNTNGITVNIGASVSKIPAYLFYSAPQENSPSYYTSPNITNVVFAENSQCTSIGKYAFSYCTSLTSIEIPAIMTSIGDYTFAGYYDAPMGLISVTFAEGSQLTSIGENAFSYCTSLTGVYITDIATWCNIEFGDSYANPLYYAKNLYLNGSKLLGSITIPEGVTQIPEYAFYYCTEITNITIPASITSIGENAFCNCLSLTSVTIPASVTRIGNGAFSVREPVSSFHQLTSVLFENTGGWSATLHRGSSTFTESIPANDLADPTKATKYLTSTYDSWEWNRTED